MLRIANEAQPHTSSGARWLGRLSGQAPCAFGPSFPQMLPSAAAYPPQTAHTPGAPAAPGALAAVVAAPPAARLLVLCFLLRPSRVHMSVAVAVLPAVQVQPGLLAAAVAAAAAPQEQGGAGPRNLPAGPPTRLARTFGCRGSTRTHGRTHVTSKWAVVLLTCHGAQTQGMT